MTITDFHSHILPALDHGCKDTNESVSQLTLMKNSGTDVAVATSHFYPHVHKVDTFTKKMDEAINSLRRERIVCAPKLAVGAEVLLCENLNTMKGLPELCVRGTRVLLLELPLEKLRDGHYDTVESLISDGYTVVLAHIDRYFKCFGDGIDELLTMGALAQVNASSLSCHSVLKKVKQYLSDGNKICALGSDLHGVDEKLYRHFKKAKRRLGNDFERIMSQTNKLLYEAELIDLI